MCNEGMLFDQFYNVGGTVGHQSFEEKKSGIRIRTVGQD
jgi:hypothetical protein